MANHGLAQEVLEGVGERAVADVVKQRRRPDFTRPAPGRGHVRVSPPRLQDTGQDAAGQVFHAEGMDEPAVLGAGKHEVSEAELSDSPQPLHLGCFQQIENHLVRGRNEDDVVDWVTENATVCQVFGHGDLGSSRLIACQDGTDIRGKPGKTNPRSDSLNLTALNTRLI